MCATCRYYHPTAEIEQQGWCVHPARRPLLDLVLVRGAELACRDVSDTALWEHNPVASIEAVTAAVSITEHVVGVH